MLPALLLKVAAVGRKESGQPARSWPLLFCNLKLLGGGRGGLALGDIHGRLGGESCQHEVRRGRCCDFMLCDDVGCADLLAIKYGIRVFVGSKRRTGEGDAGKHTLGTGIGKHLGTHARVCGSFSSAAYRAGSNAGVTTELYLAVEKSARALIVHDQNHEISGLAASLEAKAAAHGLHHAGGAPFSVESFTATAGHNAAAILRSDDKRGLFDGGEDNHTHSAFRRTS